MFGQDFIDNPTRLARRTMRPSCQTCRHRHLRACREVRRQSCLRRPCRRHQPGCYGGWNKPSSGISQEEEGPEGHPQKRWWVLSLVCHSCSSAIQQPLPDLPRHRCSFPRSQAGWHWKCSIAGGVQSHCRHWDHFPRIRTGKNERTGCSHC